MNNYIPDDGFTARVVDRLPRSRAGAAEVLRWRILLVSAFLAFCLVIVQIVPLARDLDQLASAYSPGETFRHLLGLIRQPAVMLGGAVCVIVAGFASIPFLRRWV